MTNDSQQEFSIEKNEELIISKKKTYRNRNMPMYTRLGQVKGVDVLDLLGLVTKTARDMFLLIRNLRDPHTNLATLLPGKDANETRTQNRALKELESIGLIIRVPCQKSLKISDNLSLNVPKRTFLINPNFLFPMSNDDWEWAYDVWQQLESQ